MRIMLLHQIAVSYHYMHYEGNKMAESENTKEALISGSNPLSPS